MKKGKSYPVIQLTAIALLAVMLFSSFGPYIIFSRQQATIRKEIKKRIKQGVPEKDLVKFSVNELSGNISWTDGKREFTFNGSKYDVVKREVSENGIYFYCIDDKQETVLFKNLDELTKNEWNKKSHSFKNKPVFQLYFSFSHQLKFPEKEKTLTVALRQFFYSNERSVLSPPPKN
ncbi:MAG: hypothetical protein ACOZCO_05845 [Bacteroidota bacterium]